MIKCECKNCVHYDVCRIREFPSIEEILEDGCNKYQDKSLIVELPCKVGNKLYWLNLHRDVVEAKLKKTGFVAKMENGLNG